MGRHATGPCLGLSAAGYYEIRWTEGNRSKTKSTGTKDLAKAQTALANFLFRQGQMAGEAPTVEMVLAAYLEEKRMGEKSREAVASKWLRQHLGPVKLDELTADRITRYGTARAKAERPASAPTVRRELAVLVAAINHAHSQRRVNAALLPVIDLPEESAPKSAVFTARQLDAILALTEPQDGERMSRLHRFIWIASETASRRDAVETLRWEQVDFEAGVIRFHRPGEVETKKRRATVPISDRLRPILWRMKAEKTSSFVLDNDNEVYQAWSALMKRAARELEDESFLDMTPHDLRRTWATLAARAGISMFDIAGVLGDSVDVVTKHYAHHSPDHLRAAINFRTAND